MQAGRTALAIQSVMLQPHRQPRSESPSVVAATMDSFSCGSVGQAGVNKPSVAGRLVQTLQPLAWCPNHCVQNNSFRHPGLTYKARVLQGWAKPGTPGFRWHPQLAILVNSRPRATATAYAPETGFNAGKMAFEVEVPILPEVRWGGGGGERASPCSI